MPKNAVEISFQAPVPGFRTAIDVPGHHFNTFMPLEIADLLFALVVNDGVCNRGGGWRFLVEICKIGSQALGCYEARLQVLFDGCDVELCWVTAEPPLEAAPSEVPSPEAAES